MKTLFLTLVLLFALPAVAQTYVAQTAGVQSTGSLCTGQTAIAPSSITWTTSMNIVLCGVWNLGTNASGTITLGAGGTSTTPLTIYADTGVVVQAPYFGQNGFIYDNGYSYVTINGGGNGIIEATANGTGLTYQAQGSASYNWALGIVVASASNVTIENWTIANLYIHKGTVYGATVSGTGTTATVTCAGLPACGLINGENLIEVMNCRVPGFNNAGTAVVTSTSGNTFTYANSTVGSSTGCTVSDAHGNRGSADYFTGIQVSNAGSNITISGNTIHDIYAGITLNGADSTTVSNWSVNNNTIYNVNWGMYSTPGTNGTVNAPALYYGNVIHDWEIWDDANDNNHHDGIFLSSPSAGMTLNGPQIYNNHIYGSLIDGMSAMVYMTGGAGYGTLENMVLFNNVFWLTGPGPGYPDDAITYTNGLSPSFYNNTYIGWQPNDGGPGASNGGQSGASEQNNICVGFYICWTATTLANTPNYDDIYDTQTVGDLNSTYYTTLANAQGAGYELNGSNANPLLNPNSTPPFQFASATSPGYAPNITGTSGGDNLTSLCTSIPAPALCSDAAGNARPSTGNWSMGAYNTVAAVSGSQATMPVCTPSGGTVTAAQTVSCTNPSSAPVLCYTIGGPVPMTNGVSGCFLGTAYTGSFTTPFPNANPGAVVQIVAGGTGFLDSNIEVVAYKTVKVATPTLSPAAGTYSSAQTITPGDSTSGVTYCYTLDGSTPTAATPGTCDPWADEFSTTTTFVVSATATVNLIATKAGDTNSNGITPAATYTINTNPQAGNPVCTPGTGTYAVAQTVSCTNPSTAPVLCYTEDGTIPATNGATGCTTGTVYSGALSITPTSGGVLLQVVAGGTGFIDSSLVSGQNQNTYTLGSSSTSNPAIFTRLLRSEIHSLWEGTR